MVTLQDAPATTTEDTAGERPTRTRGRRAVRIVGLAAVVAVAAGAGWLAPRAFAPAKPSYLGRDASVVAGALGCTRYAKASKHDESVYRYRDQGTCQLDGTIVTITTFDRESDGDAFASVMKAVIPILHPTWVGATYAAGPGWNVADARNLTAKVAEDAVQRLASGATYVIPTRSSLPTK